MKPNNPSKNALKPSKPNGGGGPSERLEVSSGAARKPTKADLQAFGRLESTGRTERKERAERLSAARSTLKVTGAVFGEPIGKKKGTISQWESGDVEFSLADSLAIELIWGVSSAWLMTGEGSMFKQLLAPNASDAVMIPLIEGMPSCGPGGEVQDPGPDAERHPFSPSFIREVIRQCGHGTASNLFLAQVAGDSMRPTIMSGDLVLVNNDLELRTKPRKAALYLVRRDPNSLEARVKRVFFAPNGNCITLDSDNAAYEKITVPIDGLRLQDLILGKVCWYGRHLHDVVPPQEDW